MVLVPAVHEDVYADEQLVGNFYIQRQGRLRVLYTNGNGSVADLNNFTLPLNDRPLRLIQANANGRDANWNNLSTYFTINIDGSIGVLSSVVNLNMCIAYMV